MKLIGKWSSHSDSFWKQILFRMFVRVFWEFVKGDFEVSFEVI
ncbi:hypothetical protein [Mesotoga sp. Brook.08.YT.4.2.5.1]|nr:hypothetical protein [Mesotoga sp. Brook.08.YT.4.2.5.1]